MGVAPLAVGGGVMLVLWPQALHVVRWVGCLVVCGVLLLVVVAWSSSSGRVRE